VAVIETSGLTKHYGAGRAASFWGQLRIPALTNVSLAVGPGEIFGFLGPNGAGKTTLIRLLLGFLRPTAGGARVLGRDITRDSLAIRAATGYLPGGVALYDTLTGEQVLDYLARLYNRPTPLREELCARLQLTPADLRRQVRDYSRGMRQKVGIIQALQHDPELAILDEPSEGLDPLMQRAFYEILDDRRRAGGTTFLSSHILSEVERICDRVAIVREGVLVALEDVTALLARRRRYVELRFEGEPPNVDGVPGVSDLAVRDGLLTCHLEGDVRPFLAQIQGAAVHDLTIEPARLEEAFMEYYAEQ
jgi:ABC-2 type transport system ATP-binding protein